MNEIVFQVSSCEETACFMASWDDPQGAGGITTQAKDLRELQEHVVEATQCHFEPGVAPRVIRLHFTNDPIQLLREAPRDVSVRRTGPSTPRLR